MLGRKNIFLFLCVICLWGGSFLSSHAHAKPNYGLYTSLINAYAKQFGPLSAQKVSLGRYILYYTHGLIYTDLKDLNHDGTDELIVVRVQKNLERYGNEEYLGLNTAERKTLQIFTISKAGMLMHVGTLEPTMTANDLPGWFSVDYTKVGGKNYIITGKPGQVFDKTLWHMQGYDLEKVMRIEGPWDDGKKAHYHVNNKEVNKAAYEKAKKTWFANETSIGITNFVKQEFDVLQQHNDQVQRALQKYTPAQGVTPTASFNGENFVVFEDTPENIQEKLVQDFYSAVVIEDFTAFPNIIPTIQGFDMASYGFDFNSARAFTKFSDQIGHEMNGAALSFMEAINPRPTSYNPKKERYGYVIEEFFTFDKNNMDFIARSPKKTGADINTNTLIYTFEGLAEIYAYSAKYEFNLADYKTVFVTVRDKPSKDNPSGIKHHWYLVGVERGSSRWRIYDLY